MDSKDKQWTTDSELVPVDLNKLSARNFVTYKFGCFVTKLISSQCDHKPITLLLAEKIPTNVKLERNGYRNSYHYDDENRILYIRQARLETIGEFMLVLIHALAHVKVGDLRDDSDQDFVREFYHALTVVCNDLFFARQRRKSPETGEGATAENIVSLNDAETMLDNLFGTVQTEVGKEESVGQLLDVKLLRGGDMDGVHVTKDLLTNRYIVEMQLFLSFANV